MKNEVDEFLDGLDNQPKDDPFKSESEDPFASTEEEKEPKEEVEERLPFHKDPKVQKFIDKQIAKGLAEHKPSEVRQFIEETKNDEDDLIAAFTNVIGNDTPEKVHALKTLGKRLKDVEETASQRTLQQIQAKQNEEKQAEIEAENTLNDAFENIEEEFGVDLTSNTPIAKKTKSEFIDLIKRLSPKDSNGEVIDFPDFREVFTLYKDMRKPESNNRAKELSSRSMQRSTETSNTTQVKDNSWKAVDKAFSNLK